MSSRPEILVINPNSNQDVTDGLAAALRPLTFADGPAIRCMTLAEGPVGIESQADIERVTLPLARVVGEDNAASAYVIACYSDPGLHVCREATTRPVFGIAESAVLTAMTRGERLGVIAIKARSIRRHLRHMRQMGVESRLAGERPLEMSVAETAGEGTLDRMIGVARELRDEDGADVIIMGCAGMARHRKPLEDAIGVPVIDPTQAAVALAIGAVQTAR